MTDSILVPIGHSGNCLEIIDSLREIFAVPAILDDDERWIGTSFEGIPIHPVADCLRFPDAAFLLLIASERTYRIRRAIVARTGLPRERFATFRHPDASVSHRARLGRGTVIYPGARVTSNAVIADHVLAMPGALVHHDVTVGAHSVIGANVTLAGGATVGDSCYIGSGSAIRGGVTIGDGALVGLGSVVVKDVAPGAVVAGNPARPLPGRSEPATAGRP